MSESAVGVRGESSRPGNYIPVGRQLPRTPPFDEVKRCLQFCDDDAADGDCERLETGQRALDDNQRNDMFDYITPETKPEPHDDSMLKGMKGYQLTQGDLEFIHRMKREKLVKQLQGDLEELQRGLKKAMMGAELVYASRENARAELQKFPSCEELAEWAEAVLGAKLPPAEFSGRDAKSLLAAVTEGDAREAVDRKRIELARMGKTLENRKKKEAKARESLEKQISKEQMKIQGLMSQLSDLKSQLSQEEEASKALEMQVNKGETAESEAGIGRASSSGVECVAQEARKGAVEFKSARTKVADDQTGARDRAGKSTKPRARAVAERKAEERGAERESERAAGAQRKPPGAAKAKSRGRGMTVEAMSSRRKAAEEEEAAAAAAGPRRSKRIASRR